MEVFDVVKWMLAALVALITIYKFFWKAPSEQDDVSIEGTSSNIATRVVKLFESHGVHRHQIPVFFDHGLSIHDCASDDELLKHLTPEMLTDAAVLFGVSLDWLQGASDEIYQVPDFYKDPESFNHYLTSIKKDKPTSEFHSYVLTANDNKGSRDDYDGLFLIVEAIGTVNDRPVYCYHFSGHWLLRYWKSRGYFTACCSLLFKHRFHPIGKQVDGKWLSTVIEGRCLLEYDYQGDGGGIELPSRGYWRVADFIEMPDEYLEGVDAERDNFGRIAALDKWLSLKIIWIALMMGATSKLSIAIKKNYVS